MRTSSSYRFVSSIVLAAMIPLAIQSTAFAQDTTPPPAASPDVPKAPPPAPPPTLAQTPAIAADGTVKIHIEATRNLNLERRASADAAWEFVCNAPCDQRVSLNDEFRVSGSTINDSRPFRLDASRAKGDNVAIQIAAGVRNKAETGKVLFIIGAAAVVGGIVTIAVGSRPKTDADGAASTTNTAVITTGVGLILGGAVVGGLLGGGWWYNNNRSLVFGDVVGRPTTQELPSAEPPPAQTTHAERAPTFVQPDVAKSVAATREITIPLFSKSF